MGAQTNYFHYVFQILGWDILSSSVYWFFCIQVLETIHVTNNNCIFNSRVVSCKSKMKFLFSNIQSVFLPNPCAVTWTQIINRLYRTDKYTFVVAKYLLHFCWAGKNYRSWFAGVALVGIRFNFPQFFYPRNFILHSRSVFPCSWKQ